VLLLVLPPESIASSGTLRLRYKLKGEKKDTYKHLETHFRTAPIAGVIPLEDGKENPGRVRTMSLLGSRLVGTGMGSGDLIP